MTAGWSVSYKVKTCQTPRKRFPHNQGECRFCLQGPWSIYNDDYRNDLLHLGLHVALSPSPISKLGLGCEAEPAGPRWPVRILGLFPEPRTLACLLPCLAACKDDSTHRNDKAGVRVLQKPLRTCPPGSSQTKHPSPAPKVVRTQTPDKKDAAPISPGPGATFMPPGTHAPSPQRICPIAAPPRSWWRGQEALGCSLGISGYTSPST